MNQTYPTTSTDYDFAFLSPLLRGVFRKAELKDCSKTGYIKHLNRPKLKFVKGAFLYYQFFFESHSDVCWDFLDIFLERINGDKRRQDSFRAAIFRIGNALLKQKD